MNLSFRRFLPWGRGQAVLVLLMVLMPGLAYAQSGTFVWADVPGINDDDSVDGLSDTVSGITMTVSVGVVDGGDIDDLDAYSDNNEGPASYEENGNFGGLSNYVEVGFDLDACESDNIFDLTLTFNQAVTNLQFVIADVDQSSWDDEISFFADDNLADTNPPINLKTLMTDTASGTPFLSFPPGNIIEGVGGGYEGQTNVGSGQTLGNITFDSSSSPIGFRQITIRYTSADCGGGNPGSQRIGLGDITFSGVTVPVTLSWFDSERVGEQLNLEWETAQEVGHAGFQVYARDEDGWELADEQLIIREGPGDSLEPTSYSHTVTLADEAIEWLALADVSVNEVVEVHGPFRIGEEYGARVEQAAEFDWSKADLPKMSLNEKRSAISERVQNVLQSQSGDGGR